MCLIIRGLHEEIKNHPEISAGMVLVYFTRLKNRKNINQRAKFINRFKVIYGACVSYDEWTSPSVQEWLQGHFPFTECFVNVRACLCRHFNLTQTLQFVVLLYY